jgi:gamma-glutamyl-gamma-aminobutyrate hydrolase PuuD
MPAALVPATYVRAIEHVGGSPVLIPPVHDGLAEIVTALDGFVFSGGSDVDPSLYGEEWHPATDGILPERDRAESALLRAALEVDIPVLAICRGMQLLNVVRGGSLEQHIPDREGDVTHKRGPGSFTQHDVRVKPDSRLGKTIGTEAVVFSHHHQAPDRIGEGLAEVAWAADNTIEGIEDPSKRFCLGVVWHPEEGSDLSLFDALVQSARRSSGS